MPPKENDPSAEQRTYHRKKTINGIEIEIRFDEEKGFCVMELLQPKPAKIQLQSPENPMWRYEISNIRKQIAEHVFTWAKTIAKHKRNVHEVFVETTIFNNQINRAAGRSGPNK